MAKKATKKKTTAKTNLKSNKFDWKSWKVILPALILFAGIGGYLVIASFAVRPRNINLYSNARGERYGGVTVKVCASPYMRPNDQMLYVTVKKPSSPWAGITARRFNVQWSTRSNFSGSNTAQSSVKSLPGNGRQVEHRFYVGANHYISVNVRYSNNKLVRYTYKADGARFKKRLNVYCF